jgi:hypothetical protein
MILRFKFISINALNLPPIHKAKPAMASTATNTSIAIIINIALPTFHVELLRFVLDVCGGTRDHADLGGR